MIFDNSQNILFKNNYFHIPRRLLITALFCRQTKNQYSCQFYLSELIYTTPILKSL
jgi:hypothetical protein